jgi:hypothetical protein
MVTQRRAIYGGLAYGQALRFLLVVAAQVTVRSNPEWRRRKFFPLGDAPRTEDRQGSDGP